MKIIAIALTALLLLGMLSGCATQPQAQICATTLPVYQFTSRLCAGTGITVSRLITEPVSCLHDYSLSVNQVKAVESAELVVTSGAGLEGFLHDVLNGNHNIIDCSHGIALLSCESEGEHGHDHAGHNHEADSHIWLNPLNAKIMSANIYEGLCRKYPSFSDTFSKNLQALHTELDALYAYGREQLFSLRCRDMITFHDGFGYLADCFDLHILKAIEEESGSEASAQELKHLIGLVQEHQLPAVFTERNGSASAARIICAETGISSFPLDMAMGGDDYFKAMYHDIDTIKEALG